MYSLIHLTTTSLTHNSSTSRPPLRRGFLLVPLALACLALLPAAQAVSPPPDGGYPNENTAEGDNALLSLTSGERNTAIGNNALSSNTVGFENTAIGFHALFSNTTGFINTATGFRALAQNTTGDLNTANGFRALADNTTGVRNTAMGAVALNGNTTGVANTAIGISALEKNKTGNDNTAMGPQALQNNTTGNFNTVIGTFALIGNTTGSNNTAIGGEALGDNAEGNGNTAIGHEALTHTFGGNSNIALGDSAGINLTSGNNNIDIGNVGVAGESAKIRIGTIGTHMHTFIAGINGVTVAGGVGVIIDANGRLGTVTSSERFKDEIKPMDKASEAILKLEPVTFRYKHELDPNGIPQFGLVAEQVEKVDPDLVARDDQGKVYTVRYEAVNAMLLNEFLKEHRKVEELEATAAQQQKRIEALTATVQKVSDQLQLSKTLPQVVASNQQN
jgi:hypothetical protein